jgi:Na+-driven multidrug efflux pump
VILQSAVNTLGSDTVAAVNAAMRIQMVAIQPLDSLGVTMATFAGQNLGAGKIKRIKDGVKVALIISVFGSLVAFAISNFLSIPMTTLFIKQEEMNPYIKSCIEKLLFINSCLYFPLGTLSIYRNTLQGLGHSVIAMGAGLFEMVGRSIVAFIAVGYFGFQAICFANPVAWIAANIILIPMYVIIMKKLFNSFPKEKIEKGMVKKYVSSR